MQLTFVKLICRIKCFAIISDSLTYKNEVEQNKQICKSKHSKSKEGFVQRLTYDFKNK